MTLFDRLYLYIFLILAISTFLLLFKPMLLFFMIVGLCISYAIYYLITHPTIRQLMARVLAESVGLLFMLAFFISLIVVFAQLLNV